MPRFIEWLATSLLGDAVTGVVGAVGGPLFALWLIPSTYVPKQRYLRWVASSRTVRRMSDLFQTPLMLFVFLLLIVRLRRWHRRSSRASVTDRAPGTSGTSTSLSTPTPTSLMADERRTYAAGAALSLLAFMERAYWLVSDNAEGWIEMDLHAEDRQMLQFRPPSQRVVSVALAPALAISRPVLLGVDNIPVSEHLNEGRPLLFVSNHPVLALDFPIFLSALYTETGIFPRSLADHSHFQVPGNKSILQGLLGAVDGTQRNAQLLLSAGKAVLVYPGGARETFKKVGEPKYEMHWGNKTGFARSAIATGATIVPCASIGTEDNFDVVADIGMGWMPVPGVAGSDRTFPILRPRLSKMQRLYFGFAPPIHCDAFNGDMSQSEAVRDATEAAVHDTLELLKSVREEDPSRYTRLFSRSAPAAGTTSATTRNTATSSKL